MKKRNYLILGVMAAVALTGCSTPDTSQTLPERLNEIWQSQQSQGESSQVETQESQTRQAQTQDASQEGSIAQPLPPQETASQTQGAQETQAEETQVQTSQQTTATNFDYDLTQLSSTVVYSQITDMTMVPEEYVGKTIKMEGRFEIYGDPNAENPYLGCIVNDATACCSVGLRFVLTGDYTSADFPENGSDIVITGVFQTYEYQGCTFGEIQNAEMTVLSEGPEAVG